MYSLKSIDIANLLIKHAKTETGRDIKRILDEAAKPYDYSNKDFDLTQQLAMVIEKVL